MIDRKQNMQANPISLRAYKAVVALNNIGVTLLQRGSYHFAVNTFRDAVETMKNFFPGNEIGYESADSAQTVEDYLQRAQQCCASTSTRPTVPIMLFEASEEVHSKRSMEKVLIRSLMAPHCAPIRLQEVICDCCYCSSSDVDLESAILLYNFGISYFCCSSALQAHEDSQAAEMWKSGAKSLLELSLNILSTHPAIQPTNQIYLPPKTYVLLAVSHAVLGALAYLEYKSCSENHYTKRLEILRFTILQLLDEENRDWMKRSMTSDQEASTSEFNFHPEIVTDYHAAPAA